MKKQEVMVMAKTITYDELISWEPCWLDTPEGRRRLKYYAKKQEHWSALDILNLNRVAAGDRLWVVLREELIDVPILHEFACRCAEQALATIDKPDARSIEAIEAKRKWLRNEITDYELEFARYAAYVAAGYALWKYSANSIAQYAAADAAWKTAKIVAVDEVAWQVAMDAAQAARYVAGDATWDDARNKQIKMLKELLKEG